MLKPRVRHWLVFQDSLMHELMQVSFPVSTRHAPIGGRMQPTLVRSWQASLGYFPNSPGFKVERGKRSKIRDLSPRVVRYGLLTGRTTHIHHQYSAKYASSRCSAGMGTRTKHRVSLGWSTTHVSLAYFQLAQVLSPSFYFNKPLIVITEGQVTSWGVLFAFWN